MSYFRTAPVARIPIRKRRRIIPEKIGDVPKFRADRAVVSAMRRPTHEVQNPRFLQENATVRLAHLTTGPHELVRQNAAFKVGAHLFLAMERQSVLGRSGLLEKCFQMPGEDLVEGLLFRLAAAVRGCRM